MDVYEFAEREDDQKRKKNSNCLKLKKRKYSESDDNIASKSKRKRGRKSKHKHYHPDMNSNSQLLINPPIKLKLVRDSNDPKKFTSIDCETCKDKIIYNQPDISNFKRIYNVKCNDGKEFNINDIVWAKIDDFQFWPSKIVSLYIRNIDDDLQISTDKCYDVSIASIEWIGYDKITNIHCTNLSHFGVDFDLKYDPKNLNKSYIEAVIEAKQLSYEKLSEIRISNSGGGGGGCSSNSVHSCETFEADTSSTLPSSHHFTSPESNQSIQSYHNPKPPSNPSSIVTNTEIQPTSSLTDCTSLTNASTNNNINTISDTSNNVNSKSHLQLDSNNSTNAQSSSSPLHYFSPFDSFNRTTTNSIMTNFFIADPNHLASVIDSTSKQLAVNGSSWDLPDLGGNLLFDDNQQHIPEFSDSDDDDSNNNNVSNKASHKVFDISKFLENFDQ